jgi:hypothetical protein
MKALLKLMIVLGKGTIWHLNSPSYDLWHSKPATSRAIIHETCIGRQGLGFYPSLEVRMAMFSRLRIVYRA